MAGRWANASGANRTVTIAISYGGTTLWQDTSANLGNGLACGWTIATDLVANGSATAQSLTGSIRLGSTGATTVGQNGNLAGTAASAIGAATLVGIAGTVNSAVAQTLTVSVTFNGTGITWTKYHHTLELL